MTDAVGVDPELDALHLLRRDLDRAVAATDAVERTFAVGDLEARFVFAGDRLVAPLTRAIAHLEREPTTEPTLTVRVWDSVSTGVTLSPLLGALVDAIHGNPFSLLTPRHEIGPLSNDRVDATYELGSGVLTLYDRVADEALFWVRDPDVLPYYELGAPFRTTLNWWLTGAGVQCVHAAAVGTADGAVMLTGRGGSGKSTTALAALSSSLGYLADDYCAFRVDAEGPEVYSLYNTGKLRDERDLARQPHFEPWLVNPERTGDEKYLMFLAEHVPDRVVARAPLRAIVLPEVTGATEPRLTPESPAEALKALAPTSMFQLPGSGPASFMAMAKLTKSVPCFRLECAPDLGATTGVLEDLLADLPA